jgi:hypothetical protein
MNYNLLKSKSKELTGETLSFQYRREKIKSPVVT